MKHLSHPDADCPPECPGSPAHLGWLQAQAGAAVTQESDEPAWMKDMELPPETREAVLAWRTWLIARDQARARHNRMFVLLRELPAEQIGTYSAVIFRIEQEMSDDC